MIKVNTLLDLIEIDTFISQWENSDKGLMALRNLILDSNSYILSSRDKSCYILIEGKSPKVGTLHCYTSKEGRGKPLVSFVRGARQWLKDNTEFKYIFNYTQDDKARLLMKTFGSKRIGVYKGYVVFKSIV